jgi:hypothetical protein
MPNEATAKLQQTQQGDSGFWTCFQVIIEYGTCCENSNSESELLYTWYSIYSYLWVSTKSKELYRIYTDFFFKKEEEEAFSVW